MSLNISDTFSIEIVVHCYISSLGNIIHQNQDHLTGLKCRATTVFQVPLLYECITQQNVVYRSYSNRQRFVIALSIINIKTNTLVPLPDSRSHLILQENNHRDRTIKTKHNYTAEISNDSHISNHAPGQVLFRASVV